MTRLPAILPAALPTAFEAPSTPALAIPILARPHPLRSDLIRAAVPAGLTVDEMLALAIPDPVLRAHCHAYVDDWYCPPAWRGRVRPRLGAMVTIRAVPGFGGGGIFRVLGFLAVIAFAAWAAPLAAGALASAGVIGGAGTLGFIGVQAATGLAISMVGSLLVNAIAPPPTQKMNTLSGAQNSVSPTYAITGSRNTANKYGPVPRVLGRHRIHPPYAAAPFTEIVGEDQYLNLLFDCGYGPLDLSDLKIGTTAVGDYDDVELDIRYGRPDDTPISLYRNRVEQEDLAREVTQAGGPVVLSTQGEADEIQVEVAFAGLVLINKEDGEYQTATVDFRIEIRETGTEGDEGWQAMPAIEGPTGETTVLDEIEATDGGTSTTWRTVGALVGGVRIVLDRRPAAFGIALLGLHYRVEWRFQGDGDWQVVQDDGTAFAEGFAGYAVGETLAVAIPSIANGRAVEVRATRIAWAALSEADAPPDNEGATRAVALAAASYLVATAPAEVMTFSVSAKTTEAVRRAATIRPSRRAAWDVRVTRLTADPGDEPRYITRSTVSALRTILYEPPVTVTGHCLVAMRIRASQQLSGVVDEFNAIAQALLPVWDGAGWAQQATRNPAWAYLEVLRGAANKRPIGDARLDLPSFLAWADACNAAPPVPSIGDAVTEAGEPYWTYDRVVDTAGTVYDQLREIAGNARAAPAMVDGKFSIVRDVAQSVPVQHFTPRNSRSFQGQVTYADLPHALRVQFIDPDADWEQGEVIAYADGYDAATATRFETLQLVGCVRRSQAWREGRYHLAVGRLRAEAWTIETDVEALVCRRGDLVRLSHDVIRTGLAFGRIRSVTLDGSGNATAIEVDEPCPMDAGTSYAARFRRADGESVVAPVATVAGEAATLTFSPAVAAAHVPTAGDLFAFGEAGIESLEAIVREIAALPELAARLTLVPAAPAVHAADAGALPAVTSTANATPSAAPGEVQDLTASEVVTQAGKGVTVAIALAWRPPAGTYTAAFELWHRTADGPWRLETLLGAVATGTTVAVADTGGVAHAFAVIAVGSNGRKLSPESAGAVAIRTTGLLPGHDTPTGLRVDVVGAVAQLSWGAVDGADHYEITVQTPVSGGAVQGGVLAAVQIIDVAATAKAIQVPLAGEYVFEVRSVNVQGAASSPATIALVQDRALAPNAILDQVVPTDGGAFTGALCRTPSGQIRRPSLVGVPWTLPTSQEDCVLFDGPWDLASAPADEVGAIDAGWFVGPELQDTGEWRSAIVDLGAPVSGLWWLDCRAEVLDFSDVSGIGDVNADALADVDPARLSADTASVSMAMVVGMQPDLADGREVQVWEGTARYAQAIVRARTRSWVVETYAEALRIRVDAEDVVDGGVTNIATSPQTVAFRRAFRQPPAVVLTPEAGAAVTLSGVTAAGFSVAADVGAILHWQARGV